MVSLYSTSSGKCNSCFLSSSIFVPRQLSYNPILENAYTLDETLSDIGDFKISVKPFYTQSVGSTLSQYFTINRDNPLVVQENGAGNISSLWFNVISSDSNFYNSLLSFSPRRQAYGAVLYCAIPFRCNVHLAVTTAVMSVRHDMHLCEQTNGNLGMCVGYRTVTESFANSERLFGKIDGAQKKSGFDDIQLKVLYNAYKDYHLYWDLYGLVGMPTGRGSKARYLFEPLVGSKHVQLGCGTALNWRIKENDCNALSLLAEAKYRYACAAKEWRSFDLKSNGQWSRYMLAVSESDKYAVHPLINDLTLKTRVTPGSSFDLYLATHIRHRSLHFEVGYDLWYRGAENLSFCCKELPNVGIADLKGIVLEDPQSASTANICQGLQPGINQMTSDLTFQPVSIRNLDVVSGAQRASLSNSLYASMACEFAVRRYPTLVGLNIMYEHGEFFNTPDNVTLWFNVDLYF